MLDCLAQMEGTKQISKKNKVVTTEFTLELNNIADGGRIYDQQTADKLREAGLGQMVDYLIQKYSELNTQKQSIDKFIEQKRNATEVDPKRPKSTKGKTTTKAEEP